MGTEEHKHCTGKAGTAVCARLLWVQSSYQAKCIPQNAFTHLREIGISHWGTPFSARSLCQSSIPPPPPPPAAASAAAAAHPLLTSRADVRLQKLHSCSSHTHQHILAQCRGRYSATSRLLLSS